MESFKKLEFVSEVMGKVKGELVLGEGAREGLHAILNEVNDGIARLQRAAEDRTGRE